MMRKRTRHNILIGLFLAVLLMMVPGCDSGSDGNQDDGWDLPDYEDTNVIPNTGIYGFNATGCFEVSSDPDSGDRILFYASDCFNYRRMEIVNGTFYGTWGDIDGTHCPTDSFGISGHFTTPHSAVGTIKYASDCKVIETLEFTATE